ncbi:MAG: aldehyde dehydrogenase family protein, partial [Candidatus Kapaibacterium sp.]
FAPMIIGDVTRGMPLYDEETFGPVMSIIAAETDEEMVRLANDTPYGLGATVVSTDPARASRIASAVEAGMVFINDMVRSDARLPFGGVKHSGWGRELGPHGILEFVNVKTVVGA